MFACDHEQQLRMECAVAEWLFSLYLVLQTNEHNKNLGKGDRKGRMNNLLNLFKGCLGIVLSRKMDYRGLDGGYPP